MCSSFNHIIKLVTKDTEIKLVYDFILIVMLILSMRQKVSFLIGWQPASGSLLFLFPFSLFSNKN